MPFHEPMTEDQRLAEEVYDRLIAPIVKPEDAGKFVVIAFNVDDFEIDRDEYHAFARLAKRHPNEPMWTMRTGKRPAHWFAGSGQGRR